MFADLAYLDPKSFCDCESQGLQATTSEELSKKLVTVNQIVTAENLHPENWFI